MLSAVVLFGLLTVAACGSGTYDGYQVWKFGPITAKHARFAHLIGQDKQLDVWSATTYDNGEITVMVPPTCMRNLRGLARLHNVRYVINEYNVQRNVDKEKARLVARFHKDKGAFNLDDFNNFDQIMAKLPEFVQACGAKGLTCTITKVGDSVEGRPLRMLKISSGTGRKTHYINSLIHAREWLAGAVNLKIINHLISNYNTDANVTQLVNAYDWSFIPVLNPDGYVHSWDVFRYWRKNRQPYGECFGADLNRNFDNRWDSTPSGGSSDPCDDTHRGPTPNSEVETKALVVHMDAVRANTISWSSIHAFARIILFSYGGVEEGTDENDGQCETADYDKQLRVGNAMINAIEDASNEMMPWTTGPICRAIYPAAGGSIDYVYNTNNVKYTFGPELRGSDFIIDKSEIQPAFVEMWAGFRTMVKEIEAIGDN